MLHVPSSPCGKPSPTFMRVLQEGRMAFVSWGTQNSSQYRLVHFAPQYGSSPLKYYQSNISCWISDTVILVVICHGPNWTADSHAFSRTRGGSLLTLHSSYQSAGWSVNTCFPEGTFIQRKHGNLSHMTEVLPKLSSFVDLPYFKDFTYLF